MKKLNKQTGSLKLALFSTTMLLALAACSSDDANNSEDNGTADSGTPDTQEDAEYPIVIEHAFGEAVIEEKPERVATVAWGNQDVVLALGVEPVGFSAANFGVQDDSGLLPWTAEQIDELGIEDPNIYQDTDGLDFEAISDSQPDVIMAAYSGITQEEYDLLAQIAPVVAYPTSAWTTTWREQISMIATGMGMEADGEQLISDTEDEVAEKLSAHPEIEGKSVVWVNFSATDMSGLHLYTPVDTRVKFLVDELGMEYPQSVMDAIEDDTAYSLSLSAENADLLNDADIIIGYGDDELYEAVKADSRLGQIPAIERGSVFFIGNSTPLAASGTPTSLSISYTIEEYLDLIGEAVSQLDE